MEALVLALMALGFLVTGAGLLLWPDRHELMPEMPTDEEEPIPLVGGRGMAALRMNVFPRQHDRPCHCNGRALIWTADGKRPDAWVGVCRRCGIARLDVVAGEMLER